MEHYTARITVEFFKADGTTVLSESVEHKAPPNVLRAMPWAQILQSFFNVLIEQVSPEQAPSP